MVGTSGGTHEVSASVAFAGRTKSTGVFPPVSR
jgi:hypothetical protein